MPHDRRTEDGRSAERESHDVPLLAPGKRTLVEQAGFEAITDPEKIGPSIRSSVAREFGGSMTAGDVDAMIRNTESIYMFVDEQMASGLTATGKSFLYRGASEYARGLKAHWATRYFDPVAVEGKTKSKEQIDGEVAAAVEHTVAMTLEDHTIHINMDADGWSFRTILHEAMHQQLGLRNAGAGFEINEGLAEFLSKVVLENNGIAYEPYGPYEPHYKLVARLAKLFTERRIIEIAFLGIEELQNNFIAMSSEEHWQAFRKAIVRGDLKAADRELDWCESLAAFNAPGDAAAEAAGEAFDAETAREEKRMAHEQEQRSWGKEAEAPIATSIIRIEDYPGGAKLLVRRGGRDGVRVGWVMEPSTRSDLAGAAFPVTEVGARNSTVIAMVPPASFEAEESVTLKPLPKVSL